MLSENTILTELEKSMLTEKMMMNAINKAMGKIMERYWHEKITNDIDYIDEFYDGDQLESVKEWVKNKYGDKKHRIYMVTVNPKEDVCFGEFEKKIIKACKKKYISKWMYAYEWRNETEGLHVHMRFEINKKKNPGEVRREFYNTFKDLVGNERHVDVRYSYKEDAFLLYVQGIKNGQPKKNHSNDVKLRKMFGMKDVYTGERVVH